MDADARLEINGFDGGACTTPFLRVVLLRMLLPGQQRAGVGVEPDGWLRWRTGQWSRSRSRQDFAMTVARRGPELTLHDLWLGYKCCHCGFSCGRYGVGPGEA